MQAALPYALPALAGLAYLNGRHAFTYDYSLLSSFLSASINGILHERRDDINLFYTLESHAQSSNRHRPWILHAGESWTYAEAYEIVLKYGTWLKSKGVQKDEIIAMDFVNSEVFIWVWFGLWSIGAKPAFINYNLTGMPLVHSIRASSARLVLVDENGRRKFDERAMEEHGFVPRPSDAGVPEGTQAKYGFESDPSQIPRNVQRHSRMPSSREKASERASEPQRQTLEIVFFDKRLENYILSLKPVRQPNSERGNQKKHNMGMLIYTSGTTGLPKAAVMSWGKANLGARFIYCWIPLKKTDVIYTPMPLYHSAASVLGVCATLHAGSAICISKHFSHHTFWPEVCASKATIIQYVGETCRYLLSAPSSPLDKKHNVRAAFGNGLRPDVWEPFKERFGINTIYEFYSATESPSGMFNKSTNSFSAGAFGRNGTIAELAMGHTLAVVRLDPNSSPPSPLRHPTTGLCQIADWNEPGELLYKLDPSNIQEKFQGYFGNDSATTEKILRDVRSKGDAYFRSGDLVRWDREGRWWFVDRIGDTFRWKAENVSTAEVADVLGKHDAVEEANVYGVSVPHHDGRAGCAAVVLKQKAKDDLPLPHPHMLKSLAEHLRNGLPSFAVPVWLRVTRQMHTTGTNKQQKHLFQRDGIEVERVEGCGDALFWLDERRETYERFTGEHLERIKGGAVKL
ncbi:acetyl-CoA synthetase-like protein [Trematosphaeria pertusa]|uniref:Very long-chain fatty acid transport protein n=1 Tax=Trematosphaeria pertusa TaxID=390896 RepID=A0A6A6IXA5_9PLEO|nr:acetyl-CoA synthetase-like protein [Trematosphaeria pertusa]KAF2254572.1 acetyl-CoA synthetase-like protein [Trematosphaeria pertusa]